MKKNLWQCVKICDYVEFSVTHEEIHVVTRVTFSFTHFTNTCVPLCQKHTIFTCEFESKTQMITMLKYVLPFQALPVIECKYRYVFCLIFASFLVRFDIYCLQKYY